MGTIDPQIPQSGQPNSSEDLKIISGMGTIRDEINGNLDNDNIASGANINGNKLLAGSVNTTQLADAGVTSAKIADDAVTSAKLSLTAEQDTQSGDLATMLTTYQAVPGLSIALTSGVSYLIGWSGYVYSQNIETVTVAPHFNGTAITDHQRVLFGGSSAVSRSFTEYQAVAWSGIYIAGASANYDVRIKSTLAGVVCQPQKFVLWATAI